MASKQQGIDISMPADLESAQAKLVYLYIGARHHATPEQLCDDLNVKKGTVLSITGTLRSRGHLERTETGFELA